MHTKDELFREAQRRISALRQQELLAADRAHDAAVKLHPEISGAERARGLAGAKLAMRAAVLGKAPDSDDCLAERAALAAAAQALDSTIRAAGYDPAAFEPSFTCPECHDKGVCNGLPCRCIKAMARRLRRQEINAASPLALCSFDTFETTRYPDSVEPQLGCSPREYMTKVLAYAQKYADGFGPGSTSLLFVGNAGLGKTHLALAIADTVLEHGFDVIYSSSAALAARLGNEQFDREANNAWQEACTEADLLILDDLGTEFLSTVTTSVLYELVNTRMLCHRPTIYTSNIIDTAVFESRYTEKIASRILGGCKQVLFCGTDQRLEKPKRKKHSVKAQPPESV